eukprot:350908-Chlamydomonas_euryale.AAC.4
MSSSVLQPALIMRFNTMPTWGRGEVQHTNGGVHHAVQSYAWKHAEEAAASSGVGGWVQYTKGDGGGGRDGGGVNSMSSWEMGSTCWKPGGGGGFHRHAPPLPGFQHVLARHAPI